jgi:hypothetical protein
MGMGVTNTLNVLEQGIYDANLGVTGGPNNSYGYGMLLVFKMNNFITQIYSGNQRNCVYIRNMYKEDVNAIWEHIQTT